MTDHQLLDAIRGVQADIVNHPKTFQKEQQTIRFLIDPILSALGWHTNNRKRVQYELRTLSGDVDIALMYDGNPIIFVEAKSLNETLGKNEERQLTRYCNDRNVQTGLLTNGAEWRAYHFYRPKQSGLPIAQILLYQVQLGEDEEAARSATSQLSMFAYDSIDKINTKKRSILLNKYWQEKGKEELLKYLQKNYTRKFLNSFHEWSGLQDGAKASHEEVHELLLKKLNQEQQHRSTRPSQPTSQSRLRPTPSDMGRAIVLDGEHIPIKRSNEVLIQTAEWLVARGKLRSQNCPIPFGRGGRYLVHIQAQHHNGNRFFSPKTLSNGLFLEAHGSTSGMIKCAFDLLKHCGYTPPEDTLKFSGFDD